MNRVLLAVVLISAYAAVAAAQTPAAAGDVAAGKALWDGNTTSCKNCHGNKAEGGYGPDLAGRKITNAHFLHAVQKPWGVMPSFPQFNDKQLSDMYAYVSSLPGVPEPAAWRVPPPAHHAVQKPGGVMPSFPQFNDKQLSDMYAYVSSLPGVPEPAAWRFPRPENAPK